METQPSGYGSAALRADDRIEVYPFTRQLEGEEIVIGRPDTGTFLALPLEAVELLDNLAEGKTVGAVEDEYKRIHGVRPDLADLLQILAKKGLVRRHNLTAAISQAPLSGVTPTLPGLRYHFANIPENVARTFFGGPALLVYTMLIALALVLIAKDPTLIPHRKDLFFDKHKTGKVLLLALASYSSLFLHEFCHLLAARAVGVKSRIGLGNRLWVLVAETDLTGLWAVPKRRRYLPMLAGPISDSVIASLLIFALAAQKVGRVSIPPDLLDLARAMILIFAFRLLWQCFFFVRTDFYYVISTFCGCKSLMRDTQTFVRNLFARFFRPSSVKNLDHIPLNERRVIAAYSILWFLGRAFAFSVLFLVTLPILARYLASAWAAVDAGFQVDPYRFLDSIVVNLLGLAPIALGLSLWVTSILRRKSA
jgi:putative peptide zinc metalloprotease protein